MNWHRLSAVELLEGYRARRFTPRDVIEDVIAALEATNAPAMSS